MIKPVAFISVDPGMKGAWCLLVPSTKHIAFFPTSAKPMDVIQWIFACVSEYDVRIIMIEDVHAIYGTSAGSNFKFGYNVGVVNALAEASAIGVDKVTPKQWQKIIGVKKKGAAIKKEVASIMERIYPNADLYGPKGGLMDGRSDSLAICHVAWLKYK